MGVFVYIGYTSGVTHTLYDFYSRKYSTIDSISRDERDAP